ncbi:MAG: hypothetical protein HKN82_04200 [Akkermansiaceae bacterium]|nr:hypothetical protein [Akkermansiaceae bacterium]NNM29756.1 hypothetical protein [Akkermansiaceae bacterium]
MNYPLTLRFKIVALAPQMFVEDADGQTILYVRQKLLKLKEQVEVFTDRSRATRLAHIQANRILDWSARYMFTDASGEEIGSVGRKGLRSLWKAHYEVFNPGDEQHDFSIHEENPWAKVADSVVGGIPVLGFFSNYLFHPSYLAARADGTPAMRVTKQPAFWEGRFRIDKLGELSAREELNLLLSFLMLNLLERRRG